MSRFPTRISLISMSVLLGLSLSSCADSVNVEPPAQAVASKTNLKPKSGSPQIERKLYERSTPTAKTIDEDDEDEATATLLKTAEKMLRTNDFVSANMLYQRALGVNPESIAALKGMAHVAELRERPQEALQSYREIIRLDGENETAHLGVARNLMTLGLYDKAIDQLEKFRGIKGDSPEILNMMGMAYTRAENSPGHFDKAIETFKTSLALDPDRLTTRNNLGFTYILAGHIPEAIELLEKLVEDPRATVQYRQNLALAYGIAGREADARAMALQDLPRSAVKKNLESYHTMREKILGLKHSPASHTAPAKKPDAKQPEAKVPDEKKSGEKTEQKSD
jgi:Flp pilus assembly protein TadD